MMQLNLNPYYTVFLLLFFWIIDVHIISRGCQNIVFSISTLQERQAVIQIFKRIKFVKSNNTTV